MSREGKAGFARPLRKGSRPAVSDPSWSIVRVPLFVLLCLGDARGVGAVVGVLECRAAVDACATESSRGGVSFAARGGQPAGPRHLEPTREDGPAPLGVLVELRLLEGGAASLAVEGHHLQNVPPDAGVRSGAEVSLWRSPSCPRTAQVLNPGSDLVLGVGGIERGSGEVLPSVAGCEDRGCPIGFQPRRSGSA